MSRDRERTVTVISVVLTLVALVGFLTFDDGPVGTRMRNLLHSEQRLRPAVDAGTSGPYAFLNTQPDGDPVGFSPCHPVHYVVNPAGAPSGWEGFVRTAVTEVADRTGLQFEDDGRTDDRDFEDRIGFNGRDRPVLIGWASADEVAALDDDVAGIGGPVMVTLGRARSYVSGSVVIDTEVSDRLGDSPYGDDVQVALLLHELGHLVGLDHVDDKGELMYPSGVNRPDYGPGDRQGLARLGAIPC